MSNDMNDIDITQLTDLQTNLWQEHEQNKDWKRSLKAYERCVACSQETQEL
jgi:hypothetical protein